MDFSGDGGFKQQKWRVLEGFCPEMRANLRQMSQAEMGDGGERLWVLVSKMFAFHFTWVSFIFILWALGLVIAAQNECCIRCNPTIATHGSIWVCVHLGYPQTWCLIMVHQHFPDSRIAVLGWNWGVHPFSETHTHTQTVKSERRKRHVDIHITHGLESLEARQTAWSVIWLIWASKKWSLTMIHSRLWVSNTWYIDTLIH